MTLEYRNLLQGELPFYLPESLRDKGLRDEVVTDDLVIASDRRFRRQRSLIGQSHFNLNQLWKPLKAVVGR